MAKTSKGGGLVILGLDGPDKATLAKAIKDKTKVESAPIATKAEQDSLMFGQEVQEGEELARCSNVS